MSPEAARVTRLALDNPVNALVVDRLAELDVPDAWLVSGSVFQSVWNGLTGRDPAYGIADYDVFYFDPDTSYEAENAVIASCATAFADVAAEVQVRNQARVHLWYPQKFGRPYAPLADTREALTRFLAPCCAVALRRTPDGLALAAPFGVGDLLAMIVRPNPAVGGSSGQYDAKTARWRRHWPELTIYPWPG